MNYLKDKKQLFNARIKDRKKSLSYFKQKEYKNSKTCEGCKYFEPLSPSMNRCHLISLSIEHRVASISLVGICKEFDNTFSMGGVYDNYKNIEYEDIRWLDVAKFKMEGILYSH